MNNRREQILVERRRIKRSCQPTDHPPNDDHDDRSKAGEPVIRQPIQWKNILLATKVNLFISISHSSFPQRRVFIINNSRATRDLLWVLELLQEAFGNIAGTVVEWYGQLLRHNMTGADGHVSAEACPARDNKSYNCADKRTLFPATEQKISHAFSFSKPMTHSAG